MTHRSKSNLPFLRQLQKNLLEGATSTGELVGKAMKESKRALVAVDEKYDITERAQLFGQAVQAKAKVVDARFDLVARGKVGFQAIQRTGSQVIDQIKTTSDESGLTAVLQDKVVAPASRAADSVFRDPRFIEGMARSQRTYGAVRETIKPYFAAADAHELLANTKAELAYVSACILQISAADSNQLAEQFGRAVTAKLAGAGTTAALLAIVSSLGSASTGTAIATLSGAAATKATLACVGGLVGGGMAAGTVLTGGVTIVVGLAAYKALASERRSFESLSELEVRILQSCWMMMAICDAYLSKAVGDFTARDAKTLLENSFRPLYADLLVNVDILCAPLDNKHTIAFRQHVLTDYRRVVIEGFEKLIEGSAGRGGVPADAVVGGVFYALMTRHALDDSMESQLVLSALRRFKSELSGASEYELGDYLRQLPESSLKPVAESVKGIYHELLWVERYNATHTSTYAEVFPDTNHPGADVMVRDVKTHAVVQELQLKAVGTNAPVAEHIERYPDVPVAATDEVADRMADDGVIHSGFANESLREKMHSDFAAIHEHTILNRTADAALLSLGIASSQELFQMMRGERKFPDAVLNAATKTGVAAGSTALTAFLFA